ncbi:MAG: lamin tail domain-containing protein, partial [Patescibacteria group bacterium]
QQTTPTNSTNIALWHSLKINEFMPNPAEGGEWVELYNPTDTNLDLKGGIICDDRVATFCKIISLDGMVAPAKNFLLVKLSGSKLNNSGDAVILKSPIGTIVDRVNYGGESVPEKGESFARKTDGFDTDGDGDWTIASKPTSGGTNGAFEVKTESSAGEEILETVGEIKIIKDIASVVAVEKASASEGTVLKSTTKKTTAKSTVAKTGFAVSSVRLADARQLAKGKNVKIKGLVTSLPGTYGTQYFYLSDEDGGIQIFQQKKDFPELALGDYVEATGVVSLANGIKRVNIKNKDGLDILSVSNPIEPNLLSFSELDDSRLGSLVKVSGEITEIKSSLMYIDDGEMELAVYFKKGAKIDKSEFTEGETVEVAGILEKSKDETQVWPRSNDDIVSVGTEAAANKEKTNEEKNTAEKYLTVSAVGLSAALLGLYARTKWVLVSGTARRIVGFILKIRE